MNSGMPAVLELDNVTVAYRGHPALHHLRGRVERGSLTAVTGPNGAGKSTLLGALTGEIRPVQGGIRRAPDVRLAYLPQQSRIDRSFPIRVLDVVATGLWAELGWWKRLTAAQLRRIESALDTVGLAGFEHRTIAEMSVGQFQRLLFARLLLQDADVLLLDEPFNAVDARTTADLQHVIQDWHRQGRTVMVVLHDLAQVRAHFPQTLLLARHVVAWGPTSEVLSDAHLAQARRMSETWDEEAPRCAAAPSSR